MNLPNSILSCFVIITQFSHIINIQFPFFKAKKFPHQISDTGILKIYKWGNLKEDYDLLIVVVFALQSIKANFACSYLYNVFNVKYEDLTVANVTGIKSLLNSIYNSIHRNL